MSFTNKTEHYGLPQYIGTDKPTCLGDFNMAMETIDGQMYKNAQSAGESTGSVAELTTQLNTLTESVSTANQNVSQLETQAGTLETNLTTITQNASSALSTAQNAQASAQTANQTATQANTTASSAQTQGESNATSIADLQERVTALEDGKEPAIQIIEKNFNGSFTRATPFQIPQTTTNNKNTYNYIGTKNVIISSGHFENQSSNISFTVDSAGKVSAGMFSSDFVFSCEGTALYQLQTQ